MSASQSDNPEERSASDRYDARQKESRDFCRADTRKRCDTIGDAAEQDRLAGDSSKPRTEDALRAAGVAPDIITKNVPAFGEYLCRREQYKECMEEEEALNREEAAEEGLIVEDVQECSDTLKLCRPVEKRTYKGR